MEDRALKTLFERLKESVSAGDDAPEGGDAGEPSDESVEPAWETDTGPPAGAFHAGGRVKPLFPRERCWGEGRRAIRPTGRARPRTCPSPPAPLPRGEGRRPVSPGSMKWTWDRRGGGSADLFDGPEDYPEDYDKEAGGDAVPLRVREASPEYLVAGSGRAAAQPHPGGDVGAPCGTGCRSRQEASRPGKRRSAASSSRGDSAPRRASSSPASSSPASGTWCAGAATARVPGASTRGRGSRCPPYSAPCARLPTTRRPVRDGALDVDAPPARWTPKRPEEILALTVCDPACGSGTFPLGRASFSHRCALCLAPAPRAHRARWGARAGAVAWACGATEP